MASVPARVNNKAAEYNRLYRERNREKINQQRRESRQRQRNLYQKHTVQNSDNVAKTNKETCDRQLRSNSHTQRQQRYYERHREEINKRKRDHRRMLNACKSIPATAAERNRKYRERKKHEINERRRHSRRRQQYLQRLQAEYNIDRTNVCEQITTSDGQSLHCSYYDDIKQLVLGQSEWVPAILQTSEDTKQLDLINMALKEEFPKLPDVDSNPKTVEVNIVRPEFVSVKCEVDADNCPANVKKKERQKRYREQNRVKLKQREQERRKRRKQNLQTVAETSTSSNIHRIEIINKEITYENPQSTKFTLDRTQTSTEENECFRTGKKDALRSKRVRQLRYRKRNREKLKQREAERRQRIQCSKMIAESYSSSNIMHEEKTMDMDMAVGLKEMQNECIEITECPKLCIQTKDVPTSFVGTHAEDTALNSAWIKQEVKEEPEESLYSDDGTSPAAEDSSEGCNRIQSDRAFNNIWVKPELKEEPEDSVLYDLETDQTGDDSSEVYKGNIVDGGYRSPRTNENMKVEPDDPDIQCELTPSAMYLESDLRDADSERSDSVSTPGESSSGLISYEQLQTERIHQFEGAIVKKQAKTAAQRLREFRERQRAEKKRVREQKTFGEVTYGREQMKPGDKPYKCDECQREFVYKYNYIKHQNLHRQQQKDESMYSIQSCNVLVHETGGFDCDM